MSQGNIDILMELWASTSADGRAPFRDHRDMLATIDAIKGGDTPWQSFTASYSGTKPPGNPPDWMLKKYTVFFRDPLAVVRNIISNPDFSGQFDYAPYMEFEDEKQHWTDIMSGKWAWKQAVGLIQTSMTPRFRTLTPAKDIISENPDTHGSMMVPLILGSDKTLASNATGLNEFHPLYISPGNVKNSVRRAHRDSLILIGFLAIPKSVHSFRDRSCCLTLFSGSRKDGNSAMFRSFRRQLMHELLKTILSPLKPFMTKPDIVKCPDGHYRRAIYTLGPYIADYPEQVLLAAVVSGWCTRLASVAL